MANLPRVSVYLEVVDKKTGLISREFLLFLNELDSRLNVTGDLVGTTDSQTLENKTIDADDNTISNLAHGSEVDNPSSGVHGVTGSVVGTDDTQTLENKTIALGSNTVSGTLAQFNTALTGADFASLTGSETLTNKTITTPTLTLSLPTYADDTAAGSGGLSAGELYKTAAGAVMVKL